jgi:hypothetical protein
MRSFSIREISSVDRPAAVGAVARIIKYVDPYVPPVKEGNGTVVKAAERFGKAAEADWSEALNAYADRHNLSPSAAALEFANTHDATAIYKRTQVTPRSDAMAKAAAIGNVSAEEIAKATFPKMSPVAAMNAWLDTPEGREFYADDIAARGNARQGVA